MQERHGRASEAGWPSARNDRYASSRTALDASSSAPRFVPPASIEGWRESIRRDVRIRAALLNPVRPEPREG